MEKAHFRLYGPDDGRHRDKRTPRQIKTHREIDEQELQESLKDIPHGYGPMYRGKHRIRGGTHPRAKDDYLDQE